MGEQIKTATFIRDVSRQNRSRGVARLYQVHPPILVEDWLHTGVYDYVVVSATVVMFSGPETYIFPADEDGTIADFGDLDGSFRGALDHERALTNAGYTLGDCLVLTESAPRKAVGV
jgi:hypothetical protein